jgi:hypothetical protein
MLFGAPALMLPAGTADHWPLDGMEEKMLTQRIQDVLDMMPKKKKSAMMKFLARYMPPLALLGTAAMVVAPRVQETREKLAALKARRPSPSPSPATADNGKGITIQDETNLAPNIADDVSRRNDGERGTPSDAVRAALVYQETD